MLREIRELGFGFAELSHGIRLSLLPGILDAVDAGEIRISTLHNFCPLPVGVNAAAPNLFQFSSDDKRERENAWKHTLKTLDTAQRVGAKLVVLHTGSIPMKDYGDKLEAMVEAGARDTDKYRALVEAMELDRERRKEGPCDRAYDFIAKLVPEAKQRGLRLGIENREAVHEIPLDHDFAIFFRRFRDDTVAYWHDCGHAQIKENLGLLFHTMHLEGLADRLGGFHIHDVQAPARDHCPPGSGMIDFRALAPFVKPEHIKVFELRPGTPPDDVRRGVEHLKSLWGPE